MSKNEYTNLVRRYMDGYDMEENVSKLCGRVPLNWRVGDGEFKAETRKRRSSRSAARINKAKFRDRLWKND